MTTESDTDFCVDVKLNTFGHRFPNGRKETMESKIVTHTSFCYSDLVS